MAWYANANNEYIEPYVENAARSVPVGAKYIVKSYFYLGDVLQNHVESSMLYTLVRVREDIETGRQILDANLPTSLLPMITYTIEVEGNELNQNSLRKMTYNGDEKAPACLLFEVGLKDGFNPYNIAEKLADQDFRKEDGVYAFYTNRWRTDDGTAFTIPTTVPEKVYNHGLVGSTEAHFVPSLQNERYYYKDNTVVLNEDGSEYTSDTHPKDTGASYTHNYSYVEIKNGTPSLVTVRNPITENAIKDAVRGDGNTWVVPAGTPKRYFGEEVHGEDAHTHKVANNTNTLLWSLYPRSVYESASSGAPGYHVFSYLGNNGRITAQPAQGIKLTKTVSEAVANAPENFTFTIELSSTGLSSVPYRLEKADGTATEGNLAISNNKIQVSLGGGDTIYITGLPEGTTYTVTEDYNTYYIGTSTNNTGTIAQYTLNSVDFVNSPRGYGSLLIEKDVTHPFGENAVPEALTNKEFDITVVFDGAANDLGNISYSAGAVNVTKVSDTKYTIKLKDGEDVLFTNISEGITYTVTEDLTNAAGFTLVTEDSALTGSIENNAQSEALLVNNYVPAAVSPDVTLTGTKDIEGTDDADSTFQIALQPVNIGGDATTNNGEAIIIDAVKEGESYSFNMGENNISYSSIGTYSYEIYEVEPTDDTQGKPANIAYDKSFGLFSVVVNDSDIDGALEIENVIVHRNSAALSGDNENGWVIDKDFSNIYMAATETFTVQKTINGQSGDHAHDSGILFGLFAGDGEAYQGQNATALYYALTNDNGVATFGINISQDDYKDAPVTYYLREIPPLLSDRVIGMTYNTDWQYTVTIYWPEGEEAPTVTYKTYAGTEVDKNSLEIDNSYDSNVFSTPDIMLSGNKFLNDGTLRNGDSFTFELYITDADFSITGHAAQQTVTVNALDSAIRFNAVTFKTTGTKYIVIKESVGNAAGIGYDTTLYHITVNVVKAEDETGKTVLRVVETENGVLKSEAIHKVGGGNVEQNQINFYNTYTVDDQVEVIIAGEKVLTGRDLIAGGFEFGLYDDSGLLESVKNSANGKFSFNALNYTEDDIGEYEYTVKEIVPEGAVLVGGKYVKNGISYDSKEYKVKVVIEDNGDGKLRKTVSVDSVNVTEVNLTFTNTYSAAGTTLTLSGIKTLTGRELADGEFKFELYSTGRDFAVANGATPVASDVNNVSQINKSTGAYSITLDYADGEENIYYYVLREYIPELRKGVNYDTREYHITVIVADDGLGNITAGILNIECPGITASFTQDELNFGNSYNTAPAEFVIAGTKDYNMTLSADMFEFELSNEDQVIETVKNDQQGNFIFSTQTLSYVGTHKFIVKEVKGGNTEKGITYDAAVYTVEIPVYDDGEGSLKVDQENVKITKAVGTTQTVEREIVFTNTYSTEKTDSIKINGKKILEGKTLAENEFEFELFEADSSYKKQGKAISTAKNNANGLFTFEKELTFDKEGDYYFVVTEKDLGAENITYDDTKFGVKIVVKDNGEGKFVIDSVTYTAGSQQATNGIEFINSYKEISKTGDNFNLGLWITLMFVCAVGFITTVILAKKNRREA